MGGGPRCTRGHPCHEVTAKPFDPGMVTPTASHASTFHRLSFSSSPRACARGFELQVTCDPRFPGLARKRNWLSSRQLSSQDAVAGNQRAAGGGFPGFRWKLLFCWGNSSRGMNNPVSWAVTQAALATLHSLNRVTVHKPLSVEMLRVSPGRAAVSFQMGPNCGCWSSTHRESYRPAPGSEAQTSGEAGGGRCGAVGWQASCCFCVFESSQEGHSEPNKGLGTPCGFLRLHPDHNVVGTSPCKQHLLSQQTPLMVIAACWAV